jgi:phage terminase large subunit-like protein
MLGLRLGPHPQVVATTTPRPIPIIKALVADPRVLLTRESTFVNLDNLAPTFRDTVLTRYEGTTLGRQELHAEILDDVPGALWNRAILELARVTEHPPLERVVVGVDPSGSEQTECGIVVAGVARVGDVAHYYVVDDRSLAASPDARTRQAVSAYKSWKADRLVGEKNYGGDMVEALVRTVDPDVSYRPVQASRGKLIRAEPVAGLAEQDRLHHVGSFGPLEDELCSYDGSGPSPNRLDAMVFAVTELMERGSRAAEMTVPSGRIYEQYGE